MHIFIRGGKTAKKSIISSSRGRWKLAHLTLAGSLITTGLPIASPTASALDLSPVAGTVSRTLDRPLNSVPTVGPSAARMTNTLLNDTVPNIVGNVTENTLPEPANQTLDTAVQTVNQPVQRVTQSLQPVTDGLANTVDNVTKNLPRPVNSLLNSARPTVRSATDTVESAVNSVSDAADATTNNIRPLSEPMNETLNALTQPDDNSQPIMPVLPNQLNQENVPQRTDTKPDKSKKDSDRTVATPTTKSEQTRQPTAKKKNISDIFEPLISGWHAALNFIAEQPLIGVVVLMSLYATSLGALTYAFFRNGRRLNTVRLDPMQRKAMLQSNVIMITASFLAVAAGTFYVTMMFI